MLRASHLAFVVACLPLLHAFSPSLPGSLSSSRFSLARSPSCPFPRPLRQQACASVRGRNVAANLQMSGNDALKQQLLSMCEAARNGLDGTGSAPKEEFDALVEKLIALNPTPNPAASPLMGGTWTMKWTSEKEILFLLEKGLFGLPCTAVYQVIDTQAGTLSNSLDFEEDSYLRVGSTFRPGQSERFDFKFQSCALKWKWLTLPLPPVGEGWGNQVYLDNDLRIQKDSRGDMLIAVKTA